MADTDSMVRKGVVSSIDADNYRCRVFFPDMDNMVSGWLYVLQRPGEAVEPEEETEEETNLKVTTWMPKINDRVLVLYQYGWNTEGYVLGAIP